MTYKIYSFSHIGNGREGQEDNVIIAPALYHLPYVRRKMEKTKESYCMATSFEDCMLVAVSDGMGGHDFGEVASLTTVELLSERFDALVESAKVGETAVAQEITALNERVRTFKIVNAEYADMGATLCGIVANGGGMYAFNVGDSRAYHLKKEGFFRVSKDHTEGQRMIDLGVLSKEEELGFANRKSLYRYIGKDAELVPDVFALNAEAGDLFLLCTDGLTDFVSELEISAILAGCGETEQKGEKLVKLALEKSGNGGDNITIAIIEVI
jgi:protein phosphatase